MDFKKYPFDRHVCPVKMSTWEHTNNKVEIKAGNVTFNDDFLDIQAPVDGQTSFSFGQFDVSTNTNTEISEDDSKRTITGTMIFHRDSDSFYIAVFLPDLLLHAAIFASLFISTKVAGSPARVSICIIAVLAFRIIMSDVYAALPPVSYSIWLVDYIAVSQIIALIALMEFTVISSLLGKEVHKANIRKAMSGSSVPELMKLGHSITDIFEEAARRHHELVDSQESLFKWSVWFNPIAPKRPRKMSVNTIELNKVPSKQIEKTPTSKTSETTEGSEQSIDDVAFLSNVTPREEIRLHARDVQHMAYAKEIFDKYDTDNNGKISISELRQCLRYFGMYYTYRQTAGMMEAYFSDHGLSIATEKDLDEAAFFFLIVQHQKYEPFEDTSPDLFSGPPSEVIDKVAQVVYPCVMIAKIVFFKFWLTTYN
jgi:hypothetical protein